MSSPLVYVEIAGDDGEKLKAFYDAVFGWKMDGKKQPGYGFIPMVEPDGVLWGIRQDPPGVVVYIQVHEVQETLDQVVAHGGSIALPVTEVPGIRFALFHDPAGNVLGLVQG